jgi:hypothetical protein
MFHLDSDAAIEGIARGLMDRTLPKAEWTHAAHFASACWLLRHPQIEAMREMPAFIRAYNEATGVANTDTSGYHETITVASLRAARAWLAARSSLPLHEVLRCLLASELGRSDWLFRYWSREILFSVAARRSWIEPDLRALPF